MFGKVEERKSRVFFGFRCRERVGDCDERRVKCHGRMGRGFGSGSGGGEDRIQGCVPMQVNPPSSSSSSCPITESLAIVAVWGGSVRC